MARYWAGVVVVLVLLIAGQQCMSARTQEHELLIERKVEKELLIKSMVEAQGLMLQQGGNNLPALMALADNVRINAVTSLNVSIGFTLIIGKSGDGKSFLGTGSKGLGTASGVLFQLSNINDTASYEVQPGTTSLDLHIIKFFTAEGDQVGTWLGKFTLPQWVPASEGPGKFSTTTE